MFAHVIIGVMLAVLGVGTVQAAPLTTIEPAVLRTPMAVSPLGQMRMFIRPAADLGCEEEDLRYRHDRYHDRRHYQHDDCDYRERGDYHDHDRYRRHDRYGDRDRYRGDMRSSERYHDHDREHADRDRHHDHDRHDDHDQHDDHDNYDDHNDDERDEGQDYDDRASDDRTRPRDMRHYREPYRPSHTHRYRDTRQPPHADRYRDTYRPSQYDMRTDQPRYHGTQRSRYDWRERYVRRHSPSYDYRTRRSYYDRYDFDGYEEDVVPFAPFPDNTPPSAEQTGDPYDPRSFRPSSYRPVRQGSLIHVSHRDHYSGKDNPTYDRREHSEYYYDYDIEDENSGPKKKEAADLFAGLTV